MLFLFINLDIVPRDVLLWSDLVPGQLVVVTQLTDQGHRLPIGDLVDLVTIRRIVDPDRLAGDVVDGGFDVVESEDGQLICQP